LLIKLREKRTVKKGFGTKQEKIKGKGHFDFVRGVK